MAYVTRRQLLAVGAAVPAIGAAGAAGLGWRWWDRPVADGLRALSADEHDFVQALAEAWLPPGGDPPLSGAQAELGRFFDEVVAAMTPGTARELKLLLQVLDDATWATDARAFRHLAVDRRTAVLDGWVHSSSWLLRNAVSGVLVLCGEGYAMHPDVVGLLRPHFRCGFGR
ncbi:MAG: hypothetical protein ABMA64_31880 [Myxococcota bacterium]